MTGPADGDSGDLSELEEDRLNRTARFAWGAVIVILIGVVVLVVYALTNAPVTQLTTHPAVTSSDVTTALDHVPPAVFDTVGVTAPNVQLVAPAVLHGQPPLRSGGKPEVLYVGAEFCPFCGAERWPLIVALSRFGHFTKLYNMQSAAQSVFSGIQTFSFAGASYRSRYVSFTGVELYSDAVTANGTYARIATLSPDQSMLVSKYGGAPQAGSAPGSAPFVDIANRLVTSTSGFSPALIIRQSQAAIVSGLDHPDNQITQAIVASANQLSAGICVATGQQPDSVCASKGVREAAVDLGIS